MNFSLNFISARKEYSTFGIHYPSPLFRKSFHLKNKVKSAVVRICGLGFYDLFVNGEKITKGYLAPYISNTDDIIYYDDYEISNLLRKGENVFGISLGNGIQNCVGGQVWDFEKAVFRSSPKMALSFSAEFENGELFEFIADKSFKCADSPILFDDLRCGVFYDATKELVGWNNVNFDDSEWKTPILADTPRGETRICHADPILENERISPKILGKNTLANYIPRADMCGITTAYVPDEIEEGYLYDFGRNLAGVAELRINAKKGQKVILQFLEYIDRDGKPNISNMHFYPNGYFQRDIYICKGEGEEVYIPPFTYHGYRYCLILGITSAQATENLLTAIVMNSDISERGNFSCSDEIANSLQIFTRRSDLANFYYFPTDCPHREKNGWTGDAAVSCEHMTLNLSVENSYREWLNNIRKAQGDDGRLPGIVPTSGWGFSWGNGPAWDQALFELPYVTYIYRGETVLIEENKYAFMRYINYIDSRRDKCGLLAIGLGDWCHVGRGSSNHKSPLIVTDSIIAMSICDKAKIMLEAVGNNLWSDFAAKIAESLRTSIRKYLIDFNTMTVLGNCQTSQSMAIYYDVFEKGEKAAAFEKLLALCDQSENHIDVGILGVRVLFHVLSDFGESERAYKMICRTDYPSYGMWVKNGETTLLEDFFEEEKRERPNSLNHHFMGDISSWFIKSVAGIHVNPFKNNARNVDIKPNFIKELNFATAYYDTVEGKISIKWQRNQNEIALEVSCPKNISGNLILPNGWIFSEKEGSEVAGLSLWKLETKIYYAVPYSTL